MEQYTLQERLEIIKVFYQSRRSISNTMRGLIPYFGHENVPTRCIVEELVHKLETTYSLHNEGNSEDKDDYDDKERRPEGRPSTGAVSLKVVRTGRRGRGRPSTGAASLNIVRTGRGRGRPKKAVVAVVAVAPKRASTDATNGCRVPKKRGRPSSNKSSVYQPTGRPRGRPKGSGNASVPERLVYSEDDDDGEVSIDECEEEDENNEEEDLVEYDEEEIDEVEIDEVEEEEEEEDDDVVLRPVKLIAA